MSTTSTFHMAKSQKKFIEGPPKFIIVGACVICILIIIMIIQIFSPEMHCLEKDEGHWVFKVAKKNHNEEIKGLSQLQAEKMLDLKCAEEGGYYTTYGFCSLGQDREQYLKIYEIFPRCKAWTIVSTQPYTITQ